MQATEILMEEHRVIERVRFEDLWGGSSVNYEPDVAVMLNPARQASEERRDEVIFSIEKNRLGPTGVDFRHVLRGQHFVFEPASL